MGQIGGSLVDRRLDDDHDLVPLMRTQELDRETRDVCGTCDAGDASRLHHCARRCVQRKKSHPLRMMSRR